MATTVLATVTFAQTAKPAPAKPAPPAEHKFLVLLDPAHGGKDPGATLSTPSGGHVSEKDVTLDFAERLRAALAARGIDLHMTRSNDAGVTIGDRAQQAYSESAGACVTLHATSTGNGVHVFYPLAGFAQIYHSAFDQWTNLEAIPSHQSRPLAQKLAASLRGAQVPVSLEPAADPMLDREHCTAVAIELAPMRSGYSAAVPPNDPQYQQKVADALADALDHWRSERKTLELNAAAYGRKYAHP
jgi:N-acetylmuramoyl-L-alanine amidase